jgi:hypothetical protein
MRYYSDSDTNTDYSLCKNVETGNCEVAVGRAIKAYTGIKMQPTYS